MLNETYICINSPGVIGEVVEGEAIIVNLDSGAYYSLDGAGADVWAAAQTGTTFADVTELAMSRYDGVSEQIAADVAALVEELLGEGLIVANADPFPCATGLRAVVAPPPSVRPPFLKPVLQKYTDMADLLLLDPIHEVDAQGWPHPAPRA
jgi:hypothetical protein